MNNMPSGEDLGLMWRCSRAVAISIGFVIYKMLRLFRNKGVVIFAYCLL